MYTAAITWINHGANEKLTKRGEQPGEAEGALKRNFWLSSFCPFFFDSIAARAAWCGQRSRICSVLHDSRRPVLLKLKQLGRLPSRSSQSTVCSR